MWGSHGDLLESFPTFQGVCAKSWDGHHCSPQLLTPTEPRELLPLLWAALGTLCPPNIFFFQFMARYPLALQTSCCGALPGGMPLSLSRAAAAMGT